MTFTRIRTHNLLSGSVASGTLGAGAITGFPAATSADDADLVLIYDNDATALRKMTRANLVAGITGDITSVTAGTGLTGGGDTGDVTLAINDSVVATISGSNFAGNVGVTGSIRSTLGYSGSLTNLLDGTSYLAAGAGITVSSSSNGQIVITNDGTVGDITSVTAGTGLTGGGATGDITLAISDSVVATISGSNFAGNVGVTGSLGATLGFSGSLTNLLDGTSYLAAGSNVTITSASNGQVSIASTDTNTEYTAGDGLDLTGTTFSTDLKSAGGLKIDSTELAIDDSIVATISGSNFAGNVGVTGSIRSTLGFSGSLTRLTDGKSYLAAGAGISIASSSNGQVVITNDGTVGDITSVTAGTGLTGGGATGDVTLAINDSVVATISGSNFSGNVGVTGSLGATLGFSGSLTNLLDGTSYLASGDNVTVTSSSNGQVVISSTDTNTEYSAGDGLDLSGTTFSTDLKAGGGLKIDSTELAIDDSIVATISGANFAGNVGVTGSVRSTLGYSGSLTNLLDGTSYLAAGAGIGISSSSNGQIVITNDGTVGDITSVTAGTGLSGGGNSGGVTLAINDSIVATISGTNFSGNVGVTGSFGATLGLSGSLTNLLDGTSYLAPGANVTISSSSNGQVVISSTDTNTEYSAGDGLDLSGTTFSTDLKAGGGLKIDSTELAIDDSIVATISGANFSGNVGVTGSISSTLGFSGSLTNLLDGTSYLAAGANVTVASSSNGQVVISSTDTNTEYTAGTGLKLDSTEFSINDSVVATISGSNFSGNVGVTGSIRSTLGYSGSLTNLLDGTSYLAAGSNIAITSASNGQITIAAGGGDPGGSDTQVQFNDGGSFGGDAGLLYNKTSNNLYAAGVISASLGFSGSLTRLIDGTSYLAAGSNVTITSSSNGQVVIAATDTDTEYTAGDGLDLSGTTFSTDLKAAGGLKIVSTELAIDDSIVATISGANFAGNVGVTGSIRSTLGYSGSLTNLLDGTSYLAAGANVTITSASNGQVVIASSDNDTTYTAGTGLNLSGLNQFSINDSVVATISGSNFAGNVGVTGSLAVTSNLSVGEYVSHLGDTDTSMRFEADKITFAAGGETLLTLTEATQDIVTVGDGGDVDFKVRTNNNDNTLFVQGNTDRVGIGLNGPATTLHLKDSDVTIRLQRDDNSEAGTIEFAGSGGALGASIAHDNIGNDLVFDVFDGSGLEEAIRLGGYGSGTNRQVIILSGNTMHAGAMQPKQAADIAFFVSGAVGSRGTGVKGAAVFGGDTVVSGAMHSVLGLSGSLTRLVDGTSYLAAGANITITSASNGQVTITGAAGGSTSPGGSDTQVQFNDGGSFGGDAGLIFDKTSGTLTLDKGLVVNEGSNAAGDLRVESNHSTHMLFVDASSSRIGVGTSGPQMTIDIQERSGVEAVLRIMGDSDVGIRLAADSDNSGENDNPYIDWYQDGQNSNSRNNRLASFAMEGDAQASFTGSLANAIFIDAFCPNAANSSLRPVQIANDSSKNGHKARITIEGVRGNVGLHTSTPAEALHLSGALRIDSQGRENLLVVSGTAGDDSHHMLVMSTTTDGYGTDTNFYVSGTIGSHGSSVKGTAAFGGDLVVSGTLHGGSSLKIGDITQFAVQNIDMGSASSTTITPTAPLIFLDADSITEPGAGFHAVTMTTAGFSDGDTVRIVVTTDVAQMMVFISGILSDASKVFQIQPTASAQTKGASFQLVYVESASLWAVLSTNGLATF